MVSATHSIQRATARRRRERDYRIRRFDARINTAEREARQKLVGIVADQYNAPAAAQRAVAVYLDTIPARMIRLLDGLLRELWAWSWHSAVDIWSESIPTKAWLYRRLPGSPVWEQAGPARFDAEAEYEPILSGRIDPDSEAARSLVRELEFPAPSQARVDSIITDAFWGDGLGWPNRIKTVLPADMEALKMGLATGFAQGRNVSEITADVKEATGLIHWKARRIARTEGLRIAQEGLREADEMAEDLVQARQWFSALTLDTRKEHAKRHQKIYTRQPDGRYVGKDGEVEPPIPWGPNCLCWDEVVLDPALTDGLPEPKYGPGFDRYVAQGTAYDGEPPAPKRERKRKPKAPVGRKPKPAPKVEKPVVAKPTMPEPVAARPTPWTPDISPVDQKAVTARLDMTADQLQGLKRERLAILNGDGTIDSWVDGTMDSITLNSSQQRRLAGRITLHNHPDQGVGFSTVDIANAITDRELEMHVIGARGARYKMDFASIQNMSQTDRTKLAARVKRAYYKADKEQSRLTQARIASGKLNIRPISRDSAAVTIDNAWKQVADKFGFRYSSSGVF